MRGTFFFRCVKTRKRRREKGRKRQGEGEAWCPAASSSHVSLTAVAVHRGHMGSAGASVSSLWRELPGTPRALAREADPLALAVCLFAPSP